MKSKFLKEIEANILCWYEFKNNSKILYFGEKESGAYEYLKEVCKKVDFLEDNAELKDSTYDYIVILIEKVNIQKILELTKYLKTEGVILLAFSNPYGISNFVTYEKQTRVSPLEKIDENEISREKIKKELELKGYNYCNLYMPFPNWKKTDVILTDKLNDLSEKIDKYFTSYNNEAIVITDEIKLLRKIANYDKELFIKLSNSYLLEISKEPILTEVKYVSFNNYRKKEYQLTTIIKDEKVEKKPTNNEAIKNIKRISQNLKLLKKCPFQILDCFENNTLYSKFIKNEKTLDIELGLNYNNQEFVIGKLKQIEQILLEQSAPYNKKDKKNYPLVIRDEEENLLEKFHYLKNAFYDMIPKNCFYINEEYYFFDQEWMEHYLPVEFIVYRSIINSYDLIKNINVDELLEKMGLLEYKTIFDKIDKSLRDEIIDEERLQNLNSTYEKMYEVVYKNEVLKKENEDYKQNDAKQNEYIKVLEEKLNME